MTFHLSEHAQLHNLQSTFDHNNVHVLNVPFHHENALEEFHKDFHKDHKKPGKIQTSVMIISTHTELTVNTGRY